MERPWIRVLVFVAFLIHDGGTAIYFAYIVGEKTNVGETISFSPYKFLTFKTSLALF